MKRFAIIAIACAAASLCACTKTQTDAFVGEGVSPALSETPIVFESGVHTKAVSEVTTDNLTSFYAAAAKGTAGSDQYVWTSYEFSKPSGQGYFSGKAGDKYWPMSKTEIARFYASNVALSCNPGSAPTVAATNDKDIVCAVKTISEADYGKSSVIEFEHIFARLNGQIVLTAKSGYKAEGINLSFTPIVSGTYDLGKLVKFADDRTAWSNTQNASSATVIFNNKNITEAGGSVTSDNFDIYLLPGTYQLTYSYTLVKDDFRLPRQDSREIKLVAGKKNIFKGLLNVSDDEEATEIWFTVSVTDWAKNDLPDVIF